MQATEERTRYEAQGFLEPRRVLTPEECGEWLAKLQKAPPPLDWPKGHAVNSVAFSQLGRDPRIVDQVVELIGGDALLWGASLVRRERGQTHAWHTDIETSTDRDGTVSVWIGLENTRAESSLFLVPGSHRFGRPVQQQAQEATLGRNEVTPEDVRGWARELGGAGEIVQPAVRDGEALFFDGRLWHGSRNESDGAPRIAVLLQYARPDIAIRIPDLDHLEYPFRLKETPRPACIVVHGSADDESNRIVAAPAALRKGPSSWCAPMPLAGDASAGFKAYGMHSGATRCMAYLEAHGSVLSPGASPHTPHIHAEEEALIVVAGQAELELAREEGGSERHPAKKGTFAYYPAGQAHTIHNVSDEPVAYIMFKWSGGRTPASGLVAKAGPLPTSIQAVPALADAKTGESGFAATHLLHGATAQLTALKCHHSILDAGAGYEPHVDAYDVGIVLLDGCLETLGQRADAPAVIFYAAGEPHGMRNPGAGPASYLVFEFHGVVGGREPAAVLSWALRQLPDGLRGLVPRRARQLLKRLLLGR